MVKEGLPHMSIPKVEDHSSSDKWTALEAAVADLVPDFGRRTGISDTQKTDIAGGSKIEDHVVFKRGRGRPKGSKNKPKLKAPSPLWSWPFSGSDLGSSCNIHSLIIQRGHDVIQSIVNQASAFIQNGGGLYVAGAQGMLAVLTLEDPVQNRRTLIGAWNIISFSGLLSATTSPGQISMTVICPPDQACCGTVVGDFQPLSDFITVQVISYLGPPCSSGQAQM
ncbi:hypothetical protein MPTK1_6g20420 [Marchantia polymorpha subsp. ruderalis]|uniref:AT-hook motif nuclear-localized protein n=2 Tax=Marchantia polymorpha TaxID=3197 RepID=A0AAF6BU60_MARPO|nr:hypothetical protein MARPO_0045s0022 [Marchantia polymorpha]BBN15544.1 hypothetical protein Mp_6g20420 [Marchantia polymorpha subsp. ruderalis]|eukprot:PTQ39345.1 hypothetical protein MARPO_0045s0022 [Marchantia polymorpha]